jgi:hypothetical protein
MNSKKHGGSWWNNTFHLGASVPDSSGTKPSEQNMRVYTRLHYQALTDLVEVMAVLSTVAIAVDLYWCLSDFVDQNYSGRLLPMIIGLTITLVGMVLAVAKYHYKLVAKLANDLKLEKVMRKHQ